jgi:biotin carboxyl carrier protein
MRPMTLEIEGRNVKGFALKVRDEIWFHVLAESGFETIVFKEEAFRSQSKRGKGAGSAKENIVAPMPGKVTQILVEVGQVVTENQTVLVMEAMKMEYSLKAAVEGEVTEILTTKGSQVALGAVLVKIKSKNRKDES